MAVAVATALDLVEARIEGHFSAMDLQELCELSEELALAR